MQYRHILCIILILTLFKTAYTQQLSPQSCENFRDSLLSHTNLQRRHRRLSLQLGIACLATSFLPIIPVPLCISSAVLTGTGGLARFEEIEKSRERDFRCAVVVSRASERVVVPIGVAQDLLVGTRVAVVVVGFIFASLTNLFWFCYCCVEVRVWLEKDSEEC